MSSAEPTPGHLVWRLAMKWRTAVDRALDPLGLTHAQYVVLSSLLALDRPSQRELADHTGLEALYISKLARSLEASGFISRTRDAVDTRTVRLALTPHGLSTVEPAVELVRSLLDRLLEPLGDRTDALSRDLTALLAVPL
ncbi:DNA-binding transcriptional regulator, MarR family [Lentzea albidocapillata subsp. violacea]|uniref:DNA-binding transcriptional regulator, MarR family n=1 Tax=Lentzea albidocapillata subsp. violacea TaxID=128104 RepID=A0A1G8X0P6_9PSEU|nr:MarR family transcriptional regulator [Lentzea albidocapillata]SDJ83886.1 DNA-binding transcriptional regulator, MarR family [Lentzea albidocapillata subsp. violacea]